MPGSYQRKGRLPQAARHIKFVARRGIPNRMPGFPSHRANGSVFHFCRVTERTDQLADGAFSDVKGPEQLLYAAANRICHARVTEDEGE